MTPDGQNALFYLISLYIAKFQGSNPYIQQGFTALPNTGTTI
jgi:hypothetical protein